MIHTIKEISMDFAPLGCGILLQTHIDPTWVSTAVIVATTLLVSGFSVVKHIFEIKKSKSENELVELEIKLKKNQLKNKNHES